MSKSIETLSEEIQGVLRQIDVNAHSSVCIRGERVIYIDPIRIAGEPHDADLILITHPHFDHFSPRDIKKLLHDSTVIAVPERMINKVRNAVGREPEPVLPGESYTLAGVSVETVPAYNLIKPQHMKRFGWVGYVLTLGNTRVYITGDTDSTPECRSVSCDILMLPIGGTYTVNAAKAAELTNQMKPKAVIPLHYGLLLGGSGAAQQFRSELDEDIPADIRDSACSNVMLFPIILGGIGALLAAAAYILLKTLN